MADSKITFEDIEKANSTIKTMKITRWDKKQGKEISKDYAEVNQRIKVFRMLYPEGFIRTNIISHNDGVIVMKTEAGFVDESGNDRILGTGMAFEDKKNGLINGTSYIENCETSAVGRALGMCGIGIDMSIASYEEVANAIAQQEVPQKPQKPVKKAQAVKKQEFICKNCGKPVTDAEGHSAESIVANTQKKFNMILCMNCAHEAQKYKDGLAQQEVPAPEMEVDEGIQLPFPIED